MYPFRVCQCSSHHILRGDPSGRTSKAHVPFVLSERTWKPAGLECKALALVRARWGTQIVYPKQLHFKTCTKLFLTFYSPFWFSVFRSNIKPLLCRLRQELQNLNNKTMYHHIRGNKKTRPHKNHGIDYLNKKNSIPTQRKSMSEAGEEHTWVGGGSYLSWAQWVKRGTFLDHKRNTLLTKFSVPPGPAAI